MINQITEKAIKILCSCCKPYGILAANKPVDNYQRVWARDSIISGLVGFLYKNETITQGLINSVNTLAKHQHNSGVIPSNVQVEPTLKVSFGSTAGRVDATLWWTIGAQVIIKHNLVSEKETDALRKCLERSFKAIEIWETNLADLVYSPIGGNWADEYVTQGFTLYDNLLRYWSLLLAEKLFTNAGFSEKISRVKDKIILNYNFGNTQNLDQLYHKRAYLSVKENKGYMFASISPMGYDNRWDLAANALGILLGLNRDAEKTELFINDLAKQTKDNLIPVFWPPIKPDDKEWILLENNYNFEFKNYPHQFHNGGSWLVWVGWLAAAFAANKKLEIVNSIKETYQKKLGSEMPAFSFYEYYNTFSGEPKGVEELCYSACGWLLIDLASKKNISLLKQIIE
jgi:hypothetical protein